MACAVACAASFLAASCGGGPPSVTQVVKNYEKSVVHVSTDTGDGSGVVLDEKGRVLTNNHVVALSKTVSIRNPDTNQMVPAVILGASPCDDLAVIEARDPSGFVAAPLGSSAEAERGSDILLLGFPVTVTGQPSEMLVPTKGIINVVNEQDPDDGLQKVIGTDAAQNPGNSGGALVDLDQDSKVIGVPTFHIPGFTTESLNFSIAIDQAKEVYPKLLAGSDIKNLAADVEPNNPGFTEKYNIPYVENTLVITKIDRDGPLGKTGLTAGDILAKAKVKDSSGTGKALSTKGVLCDLLRSTPSGAQILMLVAHKDPQNPRASREGYVVATLSVTVP